MHYVRNLFHVKIDKLQAICLWTLQICISLSLKALESENKLTETTFPRDVLRGVGCLVSVSPESLFSQWLISYQTLHSSRLEQNVLIVVELSFVQIEQFYCTVK